LNSTGIATPLKIYEGLIGCEVKKVNDDVESKSAVDDYGGLQRHFKPPPQMLHHLS
jgi:hypothetical protein